MNIPDNGDIGYFVEIDLKYLDEIKEKTKNFPFWTENEKNKPDDFIPYMNESKPNTYTQTKKLLCDWTYKYNYLIQYRKLNFYIRHGMIVEKVHELISFKHSKWLEKYTKFITQKRK